MIIMINYLCYHNSLKQFEDFLSVKKMLYKGTNIGMLYCYMLLWDQTKKWEQPHLKVEEIRPGKMMLLNYLNYSVLIYHPSDLGVYQDESKNDSSTRT